jgi:hypothetical protein
MRVKWVLVGFGILYVVVALAFVPSEIWRSSPIEPIFSVLTDVVWNSMTFVSIGLVGAMAPLAKPLANATDVAPSPIMEGMFALICLAVAAFSSAAAAEKPHARRIRDIYVPARAQPRGDGAIHNVLMVEFCVMNATANFAGIGRAAAGEGGGMGAIKALCGAFGKSADRLGLGQIRATADRGYSHVSTPRRPQT